MTTHSEYQTKLKNVWMLDEIPKAVRTKLRLPDEDEGIDLMTREVIRPCASADPRSISGLIMPSLLGG